MTKIMITGGAGFIGSHIVDELISKGIEAVVIDNLSTGKIENINSKAKFYQCDISDQEKVSIFQNENPDYLIHLAAQIDVVRSIKNPLFDAKANIIGSINLLECCKKFGVKKIIYASSAAVYGTPKYLGIDENHEINPMSYYGLSKYSAENYIKLYSELNDLNYLILRYSNVFGPRQDLSGEGSVIYNFINKILSNEKPCIYGDGLQTRDFIYVKDIVNATISALENGNNITLNIGMGKETDINYLLGIITRLLNTNIAPIYKEERKGDIRDSYYNISLAKKTLRWDLEYTLEEGLENTIRFYQSLES